MPQLLSKLNCDSLLFFAVMSGQDPSVNVVLLEDAAAVLGLGMAGVCMGLTSMTGSPIPDAIGSLLVGALLAKVAIFIISTNSTALVGRYSSCSHAFFYVSSLADMVEDLNMSIH